jgi:hypothetical protein
VSPFWLVEADAPRWAHDVTVTLLDRQLRPGRSRAGTHTYSYAAAFRVERYAVRVRFRVSSRPSSRPSPSTAVAEVLATDLTWTRLVEAEPPGWGRRPDVFAQELLWRACAVLLGLPGVSGDGT